MENIFSPPCPGKAPQLAPRVLLSPFMIQMPSQAAQIFGTGWS